MTRTTKKTKTPPVQCGHCGIGDDECVRWLKLKKVRQRCCNFCTHPQADAVS